MQRTRILLLLCLFSASVLSGCGGASEPAAPSEDELSQFLDENPDIGTYADEDEVDEEDE